MTKTTNGILSYMTRHRTAANLFLLVMLMAGVVSFPQMRAQFFPDVIIDNVTVSVGWDGAGPEDVDRAIVQVVELSLLGVEGVTSTTATSSEGRARILMEFDLHAIIKFSSTTVPALPLIRFISAFKTLNLSC